jgi:hypothetical protein
MEFLMSEPNSALNTGADEQRIRERAYVLWKQAGCPEGQSDEFWSLAQQEISMQEVADDQTLKASFSASDPPVKTGRGGPRGSVVAKPRRK